MLEPSPDRRRKLAGWHPPISFPVVVRYRDRSRAQDLLWTLPWMVDGEGRVVLYTAVGPAGEPAGAAEVAEVHMLGRPDGARVQVLTKLDGQGRTVYAQPYHTVN